MGNINTADLTALNVTSINDNEGPHLKKKDQIKRTKQLRNQRKGFVHGDKDKALKDFYMNNVSDEYNRPMSIIRSSTSSFLKYGVSLRIYFSFMEQLIWVSLALSLLALINCNINLEGGYYNGTNKNYLSSLKRED